MPDIPMSSLPSHSQWIGLTNAGTFSRRNENLRKLDEAIRLQSIPDVRAALITYLAEGDKDYVARNQTGIIDRLKTFVGLDADLEKEFDILEIPEVEEPASPFPPLSVAVTPLNPRIENVAEKLAMEISRLTEAQKQEALRHLSQARTNSLNLIKNSLTSMNQDLDRILGHIKIELVQNCVWFCQGMQQGITLFNRYHALDGEDRKFKVSIFKGIFGLFESLPFPLSLVGKVGGAVAGLLTVHSTQIQATELTIPSPQKLKDRMIAAAGAAYSNATTLGVSPATLAGHAAMIETFSNKFTDYAKKIATVFDDARVSIKDDDARRTYANTITLHLDQMDQETAITSHGTNEDFKILQLGTAIKQEFAPLEQVPKISQKEVELLVAVQLVADYAMAGLADNQVIHDMLPEELGALNIGQQFINLLSSKEIAIVQERPGANTSVAVYQSGKIPWDNRRYDVIALMLFFEWFKENINPFALLRPGVTFVAIQNYMAQYIKNLGVAMAAHISNDWSARTKITTTVRGVYHQVNYRQISVEHSTLGGLLKK